MFSCQYRDPHAKDKTVSLTWESHTWEGRFILRRGPDRCGNAGRMGRRLFQKFVRAGRDGRPWRAAEMDFWNKRHRFLTPIVAKVHQSGPWGRAVDGRPWRAAGTDFWNERHGFLASIVGGALPLWESVGMRRGFAPHFRHLDDLFASKFDQIYHFIQILLGPILNFERCTPTDFDPECPPPPPPPPRGLLQKFVRAGRGSRPWTAGRDGPLGWTFETNGADSLRRLLQKSIRADRGVGPWTDSRDGPPGWTFETIGTRKPCHLFQKSIPAARHGRPSRPALTNFWNKRRPILSLLLPNSHSIGMGLIYPPNGRAQSLEDNLLIYCFALASYCFVVCYQIEVGELGGHTCKGYTGYFYELDPLKLNGAPGNIKGNSTLLGGRVLVAFSSEWPLYGTRPRLICLAGSTKKKKNMTANQFITRTLINLS